MDEINIISPDEIVWREINDNNIKDFIDEISSNLNKERTLKSQYKYIISRNENEKIDTRSYGLIKQIFKTFGWALEMYSQHIHRIDNKNNEIIYNVVISPIKPIYL